MRIGWRSPEGRGFRGQDGPKLGRAFATVETATERALYQAVGADIVNMGVANTVNYVVWATPETDAHYLNPENDTTLLVPPTHERWLLEGQAVGMFTVGGIASTVMGWQVNGVNTLREGRLDLFGAGAAYLNTEIERVVKGGDIVRLYCSSNVGAAALDDPAICVKLTPING